VCIYIYIYTIFYIWSCASLRTCSQASPEDKAEAERALAKFDMLSSKDDRKRFLQMFADGGGGKGKDSLKFAFDFSGSVTHEETTEVGNVEDYFSVGDILGFHGRRLSDFRTMDEALADCTYLVQKNMNDHDWAEGDHPPRLDEAKPVYSSFWYVRSKGKSSSWKHVESKRLAGKADLKDGVAMLQDGLRFMEGIGFEGADPVIVNAKHTDLTSECETLQST